MMAELKIDKIDLELNIGIIIVKSIAQLFHQYLKILKLVLPFLSLTSNLVENRLSEALEILYHQQELTEEM